MGSKMTEKMSTYSWSNHLEKTKEIWGELYKSNIYTDVTLVCNDKKEIKAHRIILNACSPVLGKILDQNSTSHPWIYLRGIDYEDMKAIMTFLYLGEASIHQEKVNEFFEIAEDLEIAAITNSQEKKKDSCLLQPEKEANSNSYSREISKIEDDDPYDHDDQDADIILEDSYNVSQVVAEAAIESQFTDNNEGQKHKHLEEESTTTAGAKKKMLLESREIEPVNVPVPVNIQEKPHQCTICGSRYISIGGLEMHTKLKHKTKLALVEAQNTQVYKSQTVNANDYTVAIVQDPQKFTNLGIPSASAKSVTEGTIGKFKCNLCDYKASLKATLKLHILQVHIGKTYNCVKCEFTTKQKEFLKKHLNEAHKAQDLNPQMEAADLEMPIEWVNVKSI